VSVFRSNIDAMEAYVPGEQAAPGAKVVKLNTNENPYPPSPKAVAAGREFDYERLRVYPQAVSRKLTAAAAQVFDVPPEWVLPGNGSDDIIMMLARSVAGAGRRIAYPVPTFTFYQTQAQVEGARCVEAPYEGDGFVLPVEGLLEANAELTFVANPNSPTGVAAPAEQLERLAAGLSGVLCIDEAYVDFTGDGRGALDLARKHENVIVLRTLSKGYSLAGLRIGLGIANPDLLAGVAKAKQIYNVDALAAEVAAAALEDQAWKNANAARVVASREKLTAELTALGWRVLPSAANFLLAGPAGGDAAEVFKALRERGIYVRYYGKDPRIADRLRITVGGEEDNAALLAAIKDISA